MLYRRGRGRAVESQRSTVWKATRRRRTAVCAIKRWSNPIRLHILWLVLEPPVAVAAGRELILETRELLLVAPLLLRLACHQIGAAEWRVSDGSAEA